MKQTRILYFFLALLTYGTLLQEVTAQSNLQENSLLWKISGNGLEKPSYVFGTIHMIPKKDFFLTPIMKEKISQCDVMTFEVNIFGMSLKEKLSMASFAFLKNTTLKELMGETKYKELKAFAKDSLGIREKKFDKKYNKLTPFGINSLFSKKYLGKIKLYEKELYKIAKHKKMNITQLETAQFQMSIVQSIPPEKQVEYFLNTQEFINLKKMVELYKKQDLNSLYQTELKDYEESEEHLKFYNDFIVNRNLKWIPIIKAQIKEHPSFIAVGAAHLPGKFGILKLLEQEGYTIEAVR